MESGRLATNRPLGSDGMHPRSGRVCSIGVVLLITLILSVGAGTAAAGGPADWPAHRGASANAGTNLATIAPTGDVGPAWTVRVGTEGMGDMGPAAPDDRVYPGQQEGVSSAIETARGSVVALDRGTGETRWTDELGERRGVDASPVVAEDVVFVGSVAHRRHALVAVGSAVPGGLLAQIGRALVSDALFGTLTALAVASLLTALVAGTLVLGVVRLLDYSWTPPRLLAARVLRRPHEQVGRWAVLSVHFGVVVLVLFVAGAVFLGASILTEVGGSAGVPLVGGGPVASVALLLLGAAIAWAVFAYRWLPAAADVIDRPAAVLRRQSAVVGLVYAVLAGPLFAFLLFLSMMVIFFR